MLDEALPNGRRSVAAQEGDATAAKNCTTELQIHIFRIRGGRMAAMGRKLP
jgi:hypothetical protein